MGRLRAQKGVLLPCTKKKGRRIAPAAFFINSLAYGDQNS
jgi:hypothetical protein